MPVLGEYGNHWQLWGESLAKDRSIRDALAGELGRLRAYCDSGFALAIHIRLTRPTLLYQTYAQDWSDHYSEKGYMLSDPVVHWGLTQTGRVVWDSLAGQDPEGVLTAAKRFGLHHGWSYATGVAGDKTIAGLTRSDRAHTEAEVAEICQIVDSIHALTEGVETLGQAEQDELRRLIPPVTH